MDSNQKDLVMKGYLNLSNEEREQLIKDIEEYEKSDDVIKAIKKLTFQLVNIEQKNLGPIASITCPCCKR